MSKKSMSHLYIHILSYNQIGKIISKRYTKREKERIRERKERERKR